MPSSIIGEGDSGSGPFTWFTQGKAALFANTRRAPTCSESPGRGTVTPTSPVASPADTPACSPVPWSPEVGRAAQQPDPQASWVLEPNKGD